MTDTIPARLAALKTASLPELKAQWRDLFGAEPPGHNRRYLESRLAYRIQELAYGGLKPETRKRLEALGEQFADRNITRRRIRDDVMPIAGTRLLREWQGVEHTVTVLTDGYEWQGRPYRSLSAVARAFTVNRMNGPLFFGIPNHRSAARPADPRASRCASSAARSTPGSPPRKASTRSSTRCRYSARPARPTSPASARKAGR
jgi:hypothetical protein